MAPRKQVLPQQFGAALSKHLDAVNAFAMLPYEQQMKIIDRTGSIHSDAEMDALVEETRPGRISF